MKKYTIKELTEIFARHDAHVCVATEEDRERVLNNPLAKEYLDGLSETYEKYTAELTPCVPFKHFKTFFIEGRRNDILYFDKRRKMYAVAIMAWLYQKKEYFEELEDILWAIMDEYMWNTPAHVFGTGLTHYQPDDYYIDLYSAETCAGISEVLALLGDKIEPIITERARRLINQRCFDIYHKPFWWKKCTNNWAAVCAGSVGITAIYMKRDPADLAEMIYQCFETIECYLSGFEADGACREGLGYWGFGFGLFTYFSDLLYKRTGGEINLFAEEKVKNIASFPTKCFFRGGKIVTFSDSGTADTAKLNVSLLSRLREFCPDVPLPERSISVIEYNKGKGAMSFAHIFRILLWMPESFDGAKSNGAQTHLFPDAQWYLSSSEGGIGIAAKAGVNFERIEPHNHNDIGSFHIYKNGANLISDIGSGVYTKTYFKPEHRYDVFACSSSGHSVPIINGKNQGYGEEFRASRVSVTEEGGLCADISGAYDVEELESLVRTVKLEASENRVYLTDTYRFKEAPTSVTERFISYHEPRIEDGRVTVEANGEVLLFGYDKGVLKPTVRVYEDVDCLVRSTPTFKAYMVDFEVINPTKEFAVSVTFE
ncbi:MAG: heparinase II/III family protein [Clostridia bacterium]|nr:heparinase II/III family protein [Clostridia bacterium]